MDPPLALLTFLSFAVAIFAGDLLFTLRGFSRSRLHDICTRKGNQERFGLVLRNYEQAFLATGLVYALTLCGTLIGILSWTLPVAGADVTTIDGIAQIALLVVAFGFSCFLLVAVPWSLSRIAGEQFLFTAWPVISGLALILRPVVVAALGLDTIMHRLSGKGEPMGDDVTNLTEEIRTVVDEGHRGGVLEPRASAMIHRVIELKGEDTAAVMTPRTEMECISADESLESARQLLIDVGHSRVPVIGETIDDIVGVLYAKDLLQYMNTTDTDQVALRDIVRDPFYVPETTGVDTLLEQMKRERVHLAIVVDEYGGVAGLVSMEDILEEIVGDIVDEYDEAEEAQIDKIDARTLEVDGRTHIDDLNDQFDFDFPEDGDYDTISGFVFTQLHRVPKVDDSLTYKNLRITVIAADERRIHRVRIEVDEQLAAVPVD